MVYSTYPFIIYFSQQYDCDIYLCKYMQFSFIYFNWCKDCVIGICHNLCICFPIDEHLRWFPILLLLLMVLL